MYIKTDIDDECDGCRAYHYLPARISMDAYYDHPAEYDCDYDWECPYHECDDNCEDCEVVSNCGNADEDD
jgi:hypothetical protein